MLGPSEKKDYFCQTRVDAKAGGNGSPVKQWQLLVGALKTISEIGSQGGMQEHPKMSPI